MKLLGNIDLHVPGERVLRRANVWDRIKKAFGGEPDLRTDEMRAALEAAALIDATRDAFKRLGVNNAVSLVIDDQVLFQDREGNPDDLGDLFLAFHENASVFGKDFKLLRLAIEHQEAGLHFVIEIVARGVHPEREAAGRVVVSARVQEFEPRSGEDAEAYRRRVEPLTANPGTYEVHRRQFDNFVERVADAIRKSLPEARVEVRSADAMIVRPTTQPARRREPEPPTSPRYDPHELYYPNPYSPMLSALMWTSIFSMAMPPHVVVVNNAGDVLGSPEEVGADPDPGDGYGADDGGDTDGGDDGDADWGSDEGGGDFGGDFGDP
jgi:hypothetical protein